MLPVSILNHSSSANQMRANYDRFTIDLPQNQDFICDCGKFMVNLWSFARLWFALHKGFNIETGNTRAPRQSWTAKNDKAGLRSLSNTFVDA